MVIHLRAECVTAPLVVHGEGPVWRGDLGELWFVDMLAGDIVNVTESGKLIARRHVGAVAAAFRPCSAGGVVVGTERGFALLSADEKLTPLPELWGDASVRMNDGACDSKGRFLCGSMENDAAPGRGSLYRREFDGSTSVVLEGLTVSNGLAFSLDGTSALHIDSPTHQVRRYRMPADDGAWTEYDVAAEINPADGIPDGLCVDRDGGIWVALWGGSAVHRFDPNGRPTHIVEVPTANVTACTLGGPDGRSLWITTSRLGTSDKGDQIAGSIFRATVEVGGETVLSAAY